MSVVKKRQIVLSHYLNTGLPTKSVAFASVATGFAANVLTISDTFGIPKPPLLGGSRVIFFATSACLLPQRYRFLFKCFFFSYFIKDVGRVGHFMAVLFRCTLIMEVVL